MPLFAGMPLPALETAELACFLPWLLTLNRRMRERHGLPVARAGLSTEDLLARWRQGEAAEAAADRIASTCGQGWRNAG